jgi:hypothetical protein
MKDLYYKGTRVSPNSDLYKLLMDVRDSKLSDDERRAAGQRAKVLWEECEAEYRKWGNP